MLSLLSVLAALVVGGGLGWYLRSAAPWCPHCGTGLTCQGCGQAPVRPWQRAR